MNPKRTHRRFTAQFKAEVALAALTERQPLAELAGRYQLSVSQITPWNLQLREKAGLVFAEPAAAPPAAPDFEPLYAAIGKLQMDKKRGGRERGAPPGPAAAARKPAGQDGLAVPLG